MAAEARRNEQELREEEERRHRLARFKQKTELSLQNQVHGEHGRKAKEQARLWEREAARLAGNDALAKEKASRERERKKKQDYSEALRSEL